MNVGGFEEAGSERSAELRSRCSVMVEMTMAGNEGIVVKPIDFISKGRRGTTQPAIKCRGPEYLRIVYSPEYLLAGNLDRLRTRAVGAKRSLASREFALGIEALERFVRREPCAPPLSAFSEYSPLRVSQ